MGTRPDLMSVTVGDIFEQALKSRQLSVADLTGRTFFGWTSVPVVVETSTGLLELHDLKFIPDSPRGEHIVLIPANKD